MDPAVLEDSQDGLGDTLGDAPSRADDFEHRRIVGAARSRLFGRGRAVHIGRYQIERRLGVGGMGEVYLGHDEALERKVAIKRVLGAPSSEVGQERLRREARALARLSHPNVVQVYEIGEHEQRPFVAMEFVDGQTLGSWLTQEQRPWRAVLERFFAAGRGLAAAHEAGLIHRDFKPDNVLLSDDGAVRVADFGLVLAGEEDRPTSAAGGLAPLRIDTRMSVTGAVLGTIRYMSLEQLCGGIVDARSDQFSFCVALYEALWGAPPFSLDNALARLQELELGVPPTPPRRAASRAPIQLWRVIRRGLSRAPCDRWPDMSSLLAALDDVIRRRRRRAWIGSVSLALVVGVSALLLARGPAVDPCAGLERELVGSWDTQRRAALELSLAGIAKPHADASRARIVAGLDRWSTDWMAARERVCQASVEHTVEPELAQLHDACLTRQRHRVRDLVSALLEPENDELDGAGLARALEAVAELPTAATCERESALLGLSPPSPELAEQVELLRRDVVRAEQLRLLGRVEAALSLAADTQREAEQLGYAPLEAEALAQLAHAQLAHAQLELGLEHGMRAIDEAELARHDYLAADLWTTLTLRTLIDLGDAEAGARNLRRAEIANRRVEVSARARARVAYARGQLALLRGDAVGAELGYRNALTQAEGDEAAELDRPRYLSGLAKLLAVRDADEAANLLRAAVLSATSSYGPDHPRTVTLRDQLRGLEE